MRGKKKKQGENTDYTYMQALRNKKVPLLVLDPDWHELFPEHRKTDEIRRREKRLSDLIKEQGQTSNDIKEYEKLMAELNDKIAEAEENQKQIPAQIQSANKELLVEAMKVCYDELTYNTRQIEALEEWIRETRNQLKDKILEKQDMEMRNTQMYKYMHNLLGAKTVEIFDRDHHVWKGNIENK